MIKSTSSVVIGNASACWFAAASLMCLSGAAAAKEPDYGFKGEYFLSRTPVFDPVCQPFTRNLNQFRKLDFDQCHPRLSSKYPEFSRPYTWQEIPLDLTLVEKAIRSTTHRSGTNEAYRQYSEKLGEERWQQWLKGSESMRASGAARMWRTKIDIDGDGKEETLLRMLPGGRFAVDPDPPPPWSCDYNLGELYVIESGNPRFAEEFNTLAYGADIIHYAGNNHYYLVHWLRSSSGIEGFQLPDIGATRGVILKLLHQQSAQAIGPAGLCFIDWVPTGQYRPPAKPGRPQPPATSR